MPVIELDTEGTTSETDESPPNLYREAAQEWWDFFRRHSMFVMGYKGNRDLAYQSTLLALGQVTVVGVQSEVELAKRFGVKKATVSKIVKTFQRIMELPPMPGQRTLDSCKTFRHVRESQLNHER